MKGEHDGLPAFERELRQGCALAHERAGLEAVGPPTRDQRLATQPAGGLVPQGDAGVVMFDEGAQFAGNQGEQTTEIQLGAHRARDAQQQPDPIALGGERPAEGGEPFEVDRVLDRDRDLGGRLFHHLDHRG